MELAEHYKIAIVGRPNVGKSSLFNRIIKERLAIVDSVSGITRDRLYRTVVRGDKVFDLIDTGGYFEGADDILEEALLEQLNTAIEESDYIVMVVDALDGVHPMDKVIINKIKHIEKPFVLVVNKVDNQKLENTAYNFMTIGASEVMMTSAQHNRGINLLEKHILEQVPETNEEVMQSFRITVIGKPNVGKSSMINKILDCKRTVVSPIPGTTRDAVSVDFIHKGKPFTLIDTAGLTRRGKVKEAVDSYSIMRAKDAIIKSDLVVLMMDADRDMESQDMRIARMIKDAGKSAFLVVNKWDLTHAVRQEHYLRYIKERASFMHYFPVIFTSALNGKNLDKVMNLIFSIREKNYRRVPTSLLNDTINLAYRRNLPPFVAGKRLKIYYATQVETSPPTFMLSVNSVRSARAHYLRYLENYLRNEMDFEGLPIRFKLKPKNNPNPGDR